MNESLVRTGPRPIGSNRQVGPLAFGSWRLVDMKVAQARERVETALDAGMNLIDTADVYGLDWGGTAFGAVEELLGRVLADAPALRDRMVLASKGGIRPPIPYDSSEAALCAACEASLKRLGVERIDLYQIHRPDLYAHPAAVAAALDRLRSDGKVAEVGVSNHTPAQVDALRAHLPFPIATNQPEFSAGHLAPMRDGTFDQCMQHDTTALAWSPLAGGRLVSGEGFTQELLSTLDRIAEREGVDRATLCVAFVLAHPAAPVAIVGSMDPGRIRDAARALEVRLTREDVYAIVQASEGVPLP
ncbi:MAG: aldo/keto reductase [bacterium]|nr:aldo/keto reductase [bacterium]